jgi:hypothetical protein
MADPSLEAQLSCLNVSTTTDAQTDVALTLGTPGISTAGFYSAFRGQGIPDDVLMSLSQEYGPYLLDATKGAGRLTLTPPDSTLTLSISGNRSVEVGPGAVVLIGSDATETQRYPLSDDASVSAAATFLSQIFQSETGLADDLASFSTGYQRAIATMDGLNIKVANVASIGQVLVNLIRWELRCRVLSLLWSYWCRPLPIPYRLAWRIACYLVIRRWRARCPVLVALAQAVQATTA